MSTVTAARRAFSAQENNAAYADAWTWKARRPRAMHTDYLSAAQGVDVILTVEAENEWLAMLTEWSMRIRNALQDNPGVRTGGAMARRIERYHAARARYMAWNREYGHQPVNHRFPLSF